MVTPRSRLASWVAALSLLIVSGIASAEMPTGSFAFELGGMNSLWMGGDEDTHLSADGFCASFGASFDSVEFCDYGLYVGGRGRIEGYAVFVGWLGGSRIAIEGPIKGTQHGDNRSGITRASFLIDLAGTASRGGVELGTSASLKFDGRVDSGGVLLGTWTQRVCYESFPCETTQFPEGSSTWTNGRWTLALEIESLPAGGVSTGGFGRRAFTFSTGALGGVAQILFGDDSICDFEIRGRYNARKDVANLVLTPISAKCAGGSLRLRYLSKQSGADVGAFLAQLQYKLFGVGGTTVVDTQAPSDHQLLLEHHLDPINSPWPPLPPTTSGGGSGLVMVSQIPVRLPGLTQPSAGQSSSASAGAMLTISVIQRPLPVNTSPAVSVAAAEWQLIDMLVGSKVFQELQPDATYKLQGFDAREVGPRRPVFDAGAADTINDLPTQ